MSRRLVVTGQTPEGKSVFVFDGDPVPAGYTYVGSFDEKFNDQVGNNPSRFVTIRVYRKN